jgi:NADH dehydrogenase
MPDGSLDVVTGAFGYTGKYITERLLAAGRSVRTITGHPDRSNPFSGRVAASPFNFDRPARLVESLCGVDVLFNTYWVRFARGGATFEVAVENTMTLIRAAKEAGVRKIVHISITNPSDDSPLPYFRGKAILEKAVVDSGLAYDIIRPTVIFGREGILINNIAWVLGRFPVFAIPGDGEYRLQPVFVEDVADMAVRAARETDSSVFDAVGPETFTFNDLVRLIAEKTGSRAKIIHVPAGPALLASRLIGLAVHDVVLTRDEVEGLTSNLLISDSPPTGSTRLSDWLTENAAILGARYASELSRHYR